MLSLSLAARRARQRPGFNELPGCLCAVREADTEQARNENIVLESLSVIVQGYQLGLIFLTFM